VGWVWYNSPAIDEAHQQPIVTQALKDLNSYSRNQEGALKEHDIRAIH
jgi:hypothetical protein